MSEMPAVLARPDPVHGPDWPSRPSSLKRMSGDSPEAELLEDIYRRFVHLVLYARQGNGTWSDEDELMAFTVHLSDPVVVCINDEPHGYLPARTIRALTEGEMLEFSDVETTRVPRPPKVTPPFVTAERTAASWRVRFDFSREHPRVPDLLDTADQFLAVAESALRAHHLRPFAENAFHAAESYAKAEMLPYPIVSDEIDGSKKHAHIQSAYDLWARLDNTEKRFPALLRTLREDREAATYAGGVFVPRPQRAADQLEVLRALRGAAHAAAVGSRRPINAIATRDITAGTIVTASDATLRPRRRAASSMR